MFLWVMCVGWGPRSPPPGVAIKGMYAPLTNMDAFTRHKQFLALYKQSQEAAAQVGVSMAECVWWQKIPQC